MLVTLAKYLSLKRVGPALLNFLEEKSFCIFMSNISCHISFTGNNTLKGFCKFDKAFIYLSENQALFCNDANYFSSEFLIRNVCLTTIFF